MKNFYRLLFLILPLICSAQLQVFTTINTRAELYNYSTISNNRVIAAVGLSAPWDAPTEIWTFDSSSMAVDNGVTVIKPTDILTINPGRFLFQSYIVKQYGTRYSKEWNGQLTVGTSSAVFDISSAGFTSIVGIQAFAVLPSGTVVNLPLATMSVSPTNTSVTVNLVESKTTTVLILNTAVEGLESHAVAGTIVYLTVKGI